jgi:hypothetical protein
VGVPVRLRHNDNHNHILVHHHDNHNHILVHHHDNPAQLPATQLLRLYGRVQLRLYGTVYNRMQLGLHLPVLGHVLLRRRSNHVHNHHNHTCANLLLFRLRLMHRRWMQVVDVLGRMAMGI